MTSQNLRQRLANLRQEEPVLCSRRMEDMLGELGDSPSVSDLLYFNNVTRRMENSREYRTSELKNYFARRILFAVGVIDRGDLKLDTYAQIAYERGADSSRILAMRDAILADKLKWNLATMVTASRSGELAYSHKNPQRAFNSYVAAADFALYLVDSIYRGIMPGDPFFGWAHTRITDAARKYSEMVLVLRESTAINTTRLQKVFDRVSRDSAKLLVAAKT